MLGRRFPRSEARSGISSQHDERTRPARGGVVCLLLGCGCPASAPAWRAGHCLGRGCDAGRVRLFRLPIGPGCWLPVPAARPGRLRRAGHRQLDQQHHRQRSWRTQTYGLLAVHLDLVPDVRAALLRRADRPQDFAAWACCSSAPCSAAPACSCWAPARRQLLCCVAGAATVYGIGKTFLWPTMLGVVSERFPRGGALTLGASRRRRHALGRPARRSRHRLLAGLLRRQPNCKDDPATRATSATSRGETDARTAADGKLRSRKNRSWVPASFPERGRPRRQQGGDLLADRASNARSTSRSSRAREGHEARAGKTRTSPLVHATSGGRTGQGTPNAGRGQLPVTQAVLYGGQAWP